MASVRLFVWCSCPKPLPLPPPVRTLALRLLDADSEPIGSRISLRRGERPPATVSAVGVGSPLLAGGGEVRGNGKTLSPNHSSADVPPDAVVVMGDAKHSNGPELFGGDKGIAMSTVESGYIANRDRYPLTVLQTEQ